MRVFLERLVPDTEIQTSHSFNIGKNVSKSIQEIIKTVMRSYGENDDDVDINHFKSFLSAVCELCDKCDKSNDRPQKANALMKTDLQNFKNIEFSQMTTTKTSELFCHSGPATARLEKGYLTSKCMVYFCGQDLPDSKFRCMILKTPSLLSSKKSGFSVQTLVRRGISDFMPLYNSMYGIRHQANYGPTRSNELYISRDSTYSERRSATKNDHRELLRTLGCAKLVPKHQCTMSLNMDTLTWSSRMSVCGEEVEFVSIFVPNF